MQIYLFTVRPSIWINENIDVQIYASCYNVAYEVLLLTNEDISNCDVSYDGKILTACPDKWIGTAE